MVVVPRPLLAAALAVHLRYVIVVPMPIPTAPRRYLAVLCRPLIAVPRK
jgi:hypothetical protein